MNDIHIRGFPEVSECLQQALHLVSIPSAYKNKPIQTQDGQVRTEDDEMNITLKPSLTVAETDV